MESQDKLAGTGLPRFDSELVYQSPPGTRLGMLGVSLGLIALVLALSPLLFRLIAHAADNPFALRCAIAVLWLVVIGYCLYLALTVRNRFVVGVDRIAVRDWRRTRTLRFADIAGCTVTSVSLPQPKFAPAVRATRLTFLPAVPGLAPLSVVVDEREPIDAAIVERLKALPMVRPGSLKPLEWMSTARGGDR
jgi:hypothetical protein